MDDLRVNIGTKLGVTFALVIALLGVIVVVGLNGLGSVARTYEEEALRIGETARLTERLEKQVVAQGFAVASYLTTGNRQYRAEFDAAAQDAEEVAATLREMIRSTEVHALLDLIVETQRTYAVVAQPLLIGVVTSTDPSFSQVSATIADTRGRLVQAVTELAEYQARRLLEVREDAAAANTRARVVMTTLAIVAVVLGVSVAFVLTRSIAGPVRQAAAVALRLAEGDLTADELIVRSRDEIGDMATSFNQMLRNWRAVMEQIRQASATLLENGQRLLAVAEESAGATGQIAAAVNQAAQGTSNQVSQVQETRTAMEQLRRAIDQIASGAQEQAQRAEQTTRSLEQMAQSIEHVSGSAQEVARAAGHGADRARAGENAVNHVAAGMEQIRSSVSRVAESIDELGGYSRQIGQIVDMISDIADQTNLLALNAAIEAARAGEHGRGFGVVAEEVRQLAERSAESTREIGHLIGSIQAAVDAAISEMQAGMTHVESGTELASNARAALDEIIEAISTTDNLARTISEAAAQMAAASPEMLAAMAEMASVTEENTAATEQMAASSDQVIRAMEEVASISEETAAGTEEVSASVEEVNAAADDLKASVQTLTDMATNLEELVGRFRL